MVRALQSRELGGISRAMGVGVVAGVAVAGGATGGGAVDHRDGDGCVEVEIDTFGVAVEVEVGAGMDKSEC